MPRSCSICGHEDRFEIERALLSGEPFRGVSKRFGTSATALFRHKAGHLLPSVTQENVEQLPEKGALPETADQVSLSGPEPACVLRRLRNGHPVDEDRIMPVNGKSPGPCTVCHSDLWRMRLDGSLQCTACHPLTN